MRLIRDIRIQAALLLLLFLAAYQVPLQVMVKTWMTNEDYSYGFMIPLVSAYMLWERRQELLRVDYRPCWPLLPLLLGMVAVSIYGILGSSGNVSTLSVPLLILLFAAFCFGLQASRLSLLPLGFLIFMIPVPAFIERTLGMHLKAISTVLGGRFIELAGIPVHVTGNIIDLGVTKLQVVDACNGMRFLFPLIALGVIYAYFFQKTPWKRVVCVLATIPIAVLINVLRIGLTGVLTDRFGPSVAQGFFHDFSGWAMFLVAFAALMAVGKVLSLLWPDSGPPATGGGVRPAAEAGTGMVGTGRTIPALLLSLALLLVVGGLSLTVAALPPVKLKDGIEAFPLAFGDWQGTSHPFPRDVVDQSGAEEAFNGVYRNPGGETASLYIGYRSSAFMENENYFHTPTVCLPASGLQVLDEGTRVLTGVPVWGELKVSKMVIDGQGGKQLVYYWFQTKDKVSHDKNINRLQVSLHALNRDNTYALFMRTILEVGEGESLADAETRMDAFVRTMLPPAKDFLRRQTI